MQKFHALAILLAVASVGAAEAREQIRIVGSSTVFPFTTMAAERFGRTTEFRTPIVESTGTGGGFKLFCNGIGEVHPDMAGASRAIKASELESCAANGVTAITEIKIGYDGIVLANARSGPALDLTPAQLWLALARQVPVNGQLADNPHRRWADIDPALPNAPIEVYGPPPTSGTRDAWVELVMDKGCAAFPEVEALDAKARKTACQAMRDDGAFIEAGENDNLIVQKLTGNPNAFGIFGFSSLEENLDKLQAVSVAGVAPSFETIADGSYPVSRPLFVYVKNAHAGVIPGIPEYVEELVSERAAGREGYLADRGLIPLPDSEREEVARIATELRPMASTQ